MSTLETETTLDNLTDLFPYEDTDDGADRATHIVNPPSNLHIWRVGMSAQDIVDIARTTGQYVTALCGYRWIPKRNPEKYDLCKSCLEIAQLLMRANGE